MILLALNEINIDFVNKYIEDGYLKNLNHEEILTYLTNPKINQKKSLKPTFPEALELTNFDIELLSFLIA